VGGTQNIAVDVRVVAATNETLRQAVQQGKFREDLFFRLNVFPIHLPPLRQRRDDIPLLMNHFLNYYRCKHGGQTKGFTQAAVRSLLNYDFPGNIRELQNLIERAVIMADADGLIDLHHLFTSGETLSADIMTLRLHGDSGTLNLADSVAAPVGEAVRTDGDKASNNPQSLTQIERDTLARAIAASKGNLSAAARLLDTTRAKLAFRAKKHGLI
jgi:transcriptional regulator with GAF, ATPase, and Fis domain